MVAKSTNCNASSYFKFSVMDKNIFYIKFDPTISTYLFNTSLNVCIDNCVITLLPEIANNLIKYISSSHYNINLKAF